MKVAYITMTFPAPSEAFAASDVRTLRDAGVDVSVYTIRTPLRNVRELLVERGLSNLRVSQGGLTADIRGVLSCLTRPVLAGRLLMWLLGVSWKRPVQLMTSLVVVPRSIGILAELERDRPDVVHLFWGHYPSVVGFLVSRKLPGTVLSLFLGAYDLTRRFGGTRWVAQRADLMSTHASCNLTAIEELGVTRNGIHVAHRGIDLTIFEAPSTKKLSRRIVTAGRLERGKGMDDALRVFRDVRTRWPDATMHVLGEGRDRATLGRLAQELGIADAVTFVGHVPQSVVAAELAKAELFILMSWGESERLPNVVKEAMACSCVCVVTETPGMSELLEHGRHGFQVPIGDIAAATGRVNDVFSGRVDALAIREAASKRIAERFDVLASMLSYRRQWQEAIDLRRAGLRRTATGGSMFGEARAAGSGRP
jgi:glycosyltransferase involved in cell wall biosynthesis